MSLAAQLGVTPVLLPVFGSVPLVSLPANLLAAPLAGPLTVWGLAAGVAGGLLRPVSAPLARLLQVPTLVLVRAVMGVAALGARTVAIGATAALALAAVVGAAWAVHVAGTRSRPRRAGPGSGSGAGSEAGSGAGVCSAVVAWSYRLGERVHDLRDAGARDGDPQPHARLVLRPGRDLALRRVPPPGRGARRATAPTCSTSAA